LATGTVAYHFFAAKTLAAQLAVSVHAAWIKSAVANPDNAAQIIGQHTSLAANKIIFVLKDFFIHGYHPAMILLIISSALAALFVAVVFPTKK
jgi:hypothetical protein